MENQNLGDLKEEFLELCREKQIPTHNKSALLYRLSMLLEKNSRDEQTRQLLLIALADYGVMRNRFEIFDLAEEEGAYQTLKKTYEKLVEDDKLQACLSSKWKDMRRTIDRLPEIDVRYNSDEAVFKEETNRAVYLYREFMEVSEKNSPELYNNLHYFICMTRQVKEYRLIVPLFLFQLMIRHTGRLATQENLNVSLKSLWAYKEYQIEKNNDKNYKRYHLYFKLFRKLCKVYKNDDSVNLNLCRYGFWEASNLTDWIAEMYPRKVRRVLTPFLYDLMRADVSCIEPGEPEEYSTNIIFGVSQNDERKYFEAFDDEYMQVEQVVTEYVVNHIEYVIHWMEYIYVDTNLLRKDVEEIYRECNTKLPGEKTWMENCIKAHIYEIVQKNLEKAVRAKVISALTSHGEEG